MQAGYLQAASPGAAAERRATSERVPRIAACIVITVFLPEAFSFFILDFRLTAARMILLLLAPVTILRFASLITSERYRFVLSDLLVPIAGLWMIAAPATIEGLPGALKSAGVLALEFIFPYLAMRCLLQNPGQLHATVKLFCVVSAVTGIVALGDTVTGYPVLHDQLAQLTGYTYIGAEIIHDAADYYRLGLFRAEGVFEHPILLGIAMCYALMLAPGLEGRTRIFCLVGSGVGLFLSLSSAPWLGLILGIACLIYRRLTGSFSHRWLLLVGAGALMAGLVFIVSNSPFGWIFSHLTLDPATGYFRLLIWQYAGFDVLQSPIVGLGIGSDWFRPEWMGSSVDSLWLRSAMLFGIPGSVLIGLSLIGASSRVVRQSPANAATIGVREVRLAEALGIVTFLTVFLGFTVHYWGACSMIISLLAGMRANLGQAAAE